MHQRLAVEPWSGRFRQDSNQASRCLGKPEVPGRCGFVLRGTKGSFHVAINSRRATFLMRYHDVVLTTAIVVLFLSCLHYTASSWARPRLLRGQMSLRGSVHFVGLGFCVRFGMHKPALSSPSTLSDCESSARVGRLLQTSFACSFASSFRWFPVLSSIGWARLSCPFRFSPLLIRCGRTLKSVEILCC